MRVFHHSHVCVPCRAIWSSLFSYPLPFSRLFLLQCSFPSFPFLLCLFGSLIYIRCSFHGHSMCVFHHYSHVFVPCRAIWSSLFSCPLVFSRPFLLQCSLPFLFVLCLFGSLIYICCCFLAQLYFLFHGHSMCVFHHYSHVFVLCRVIWSPLFSCPPIFSRPFLLQSCLLFLFFYVFLAHWSIFAVVSTGILCVSPTIATCLCPLGQSGVPFSLVLFASLVLFFHNVSFLSLSSMPSCLLIYIYCIFHGHSMCVFHHSHVFVPCRAIWSSLLSCPLPFSRPFLSECFFPFPFFHAFLSLDLYLL